MDDAYSHLSLNNYWCIFNARRYASAVYTVVMCLSVTNRHCTKMAKCGITLDLSEIPTGSPLTGVQNRGGVGSNRRIFDQYLAKSRKWCKIGTLLWNTNRNLYALYRMALFSVTLSDSNYLKQPHF